MRLTTPDELLAYGDEGDALAAVESPDQEQREPRSLGAAPVVAAAMYICRRLRIGFVTGKMVNMAILNTPLPPRDLASITATEAKHTLGAVLDRVRVERGIAITKHDQIAAVLLSVSEYEALLAARRDTLASLAGEFDGLVDRMQTSTARKAGRALFGASPAVLGKAAVKRARRRG